MIVPDGLKHALAYAQLGFRVFPLHSIRDGKCSCGDPDCKHPGKHPRTRNGVKAATTDSKRIKRWWNENPDANVGIATGSESDLMVIDVDPRHGGDLAIEELILNLGVLPPTVIAETGGDGRHHCFAHPGGLVKNLQAVAPGIDVRGDRAYIVAAPSNHQSGRRYAWQPSFDPWSTKPANLPPAWLEWLRDKGVILDSAERGTEATTAWPSALKAGPGCYREIERQRDGGDGELEAIPVGGMAASQDGSAPVASLDELTEHERQAVRRAIERNLPKAPGERNQKWLFGFTRAIAGIPRLRHASDAVLRPLVRAYYEAAAPLTSGDHDFESYWDEFRYGLDRVRFPGGFEMTEIIEAVVNQLPHPACTEKGYTSERKKLLVGISAELQKRHGDAPFFLSCAKGAELLTTLGQPTEQMEVHRILAGFIRDELLQEVQKGNRRDATRWRFVWKPGIPRTDAPRPDWL